MITKNKVILDLSVVAILEDYQDYRTQQGSQQWERNIFLRDDSVPSAVVVVLYGELVRHKISETFFPSNN